MKQFCAVVLSALLCALPASAYSVAKDALQVAPVTLYTEIASLSDGVFSARLNAGDSSVAVANGAVSLNIAGTASSTHAVRAALDLTDATAVQAKNFGKTSAAILKATAPSADFTKANAQLQIEDLETTGIRTYTANSMLFTYAVKSNGVQFHAAALPDADDGILIALNDAFLKLDVMPKIVNSRTMVPLRGIFEEMGAEVSWDSAKRTAIVKAEDGTQICVTIGSKTATVGTQTKKLDAAPMIANSRTLVPVRFIAEALGAQVGWDATTQTVIILTA